MESNGHDLFVKSARRNLCAIKKMNKHKITIRRSNKIYHPKLLKQSYKVHKASNKFLFIKENEVLLPPPYESEMNSLNEILED